jgi:hypothetical protein
LLQVLLYATALSKAIEEQGLEAKSNGSLIVEKIWNSTIQGKSLLSKTQVSFFFFDQKNSRLNVNLCEKLRNRSQK